MFPAPARRSGPRAARLVPLLVAVTVGLLAAPAAQAAFVGEATDPAGDAAAPEGARDIVAAGVGYDRTTGRIKAAVALREVPYSASRAALVAYAGRRTPSGCDRGPTVGLTASTIGFTGTWLRFDTPGVVAARGEADKQGGSTRVQEVEAVSRRLAGLTPDCAVVSLVHPDGPQVLFDTLTFSLRPLPSLGVRLSGLPRTVRSGRRHTLRIRLSNPGDAPTGRIRVRLGALRGMTAKRAHVVPSLKAGAARTVRVRVTFSARARTGNDLAVTATAGELRAKAERRVSVLRPTRPGGGSGGGGGGGGTPAVCTQFFPDLSGDTGGSLGMVPCVR
ncbi:COG1470 family protein [Patulibacter sp. S7RM1-6]